MTTEVAVLDASALLAYVNGEHGSDIVRDLLTKGGSCSAANWAEVAQKVRASNADWSLVRGLLLSFELNIEPVTIVDAEAAAGLWRRGSGLSLADRLCLALALRLDAVAWTADMEWTGIDRVRMIR